LFTLAPRNANTVTRAMKLPQYSGKDYIIMLWTVTPFSVLLNSIIFGKQYYSDWKIFAAATIITFLVIALSFVVYGGVAVAFRERWPEDSMFIKRTVMLLGIFMIMTGLIMLAVFTIFESIPLFHFTYTNSTFAGAYSATVVLNIFLTILHEAVSKFESYKATLIETEQLKKEYMHSQLLGLKSQVNPHFLFNGLNSLSSLITEEPDKAERFLDEMSKVYRYMLRNDEDQLVELQTELNFITSYYYLLYVRYGDGVLLVVDVSEEQRKKRIPPLTLQVLFEHAFNRNMISKEHPLTIEIRSVNETWLEVKNNIQEKVGSDDTANKEGMRNIINKFRLLCQQTVTIEDDGRHRIVRLPLIKKEEMSAV
jgi:two-component system LytT family sensor kinase